MPAQLHFTIPAFSLTYKRDPNTGEYSVVKILNTVEVPDDKLITPAVCLNAQIFLNGRHRQVSVTYDKKNIYLASHNENNEVEYYLLAPEPDHLGQIQLRLVGDHTNVFQGLNQNFASAHRFRGKLNHLVSPQLHILFRQKLAGVDMHIRTRDTRLSWAEVRQLNQLCAKLSALPADSDDDEIKEKRLTINQKLNNAIEKILSRHGYSNEEQKEIIAEYGFSHPVGSAINHELPDKVKNEILPKIKANLGSQSITNSYLQGMLKRQGVAIDDIDKAHAINTFFLRHLPENLTLAQLQQCLTENGINLTVTNDDMQGIFYAHVDIYYFYQLRNPVLRKYLLDYYPHLKTDEDGLLDAESVRNAIKYLNDPSHFDGGIIDEEVLRAELPKLVNESTTTEDLALSTQRRANDQKTPCELDYINYYQQSLHIIDTLIKPEFPELADDIEAVLRLQTDFLFDEREPNKPRMALKINDPAVVTEIIQAIRFDINNGANLYEALDRDRLSKILVLDSPVFRGIPQDIESEQKQQLMLEQFNLLNAAYYKRLNNIHQKTQNPRVNVKDAYLNFMNDQGNSISFRVSIPEDDNTPAKLIVLKNETSPEFQQHPVLDLLVEDPVEAETDRRVYGPGWLRDKPFWDNREGAKEWYQLHWCARTESLCRISQSGTKTAYFFDEEENKWKAITDPAQLQKISWPQHKIAFPPRAPLAMRSFVSVDASATFTDEEGLQQCLDKYKGGFEKHVQRYQPKKILDHIASLQAALPSANAVFVTKQKRERIEKAQMLLPELERVITQARARLVQRQERFAATIKASIDSSAQSSSDEENAVYDLAAAKQGQISELYHRHYESIISQYTHMLTTVKRVQDRVDSTLAKTQIGVQTKLSSQPEHVQLGFGRNEEDSNLYTPNDPDARSEPREIPLQVTEECSTTVYTDQHRTVVPIPESAGKEECIEIFHSSSAIAFDQLPIIINFKSKKNSAVEGAKVLRDQALIYLKEQGLDPNTNLVINGKPYHKSELSGVDSQYLAGVRNDLLQSSVRIQQERAMVEAVDGIQDIIEANRPRRPTPTPDGTAVAATAG